MVIRVSVRRGPGSSGPGLGTIRAVLGIRASIDYLELLRVVGSEQFVQDG
jgi:hypothetical protein